MKDFNFFKKNDMIYKYEYFLMRKKNFQKEKISIIKETEKIQKRRKNEEIIVFVVNYSYIDFDC